MTGPRTVKVALNLAAVGRALDLAEGQRPIHMYVTDDPHVLWVVVEGGDEFPDADPNVPADMVRLHGHESPIVYAHVIPKPH